MDQLTADDYKTDVALPPGNFYFWPLTRIGALSIDGLLLITFILLWVVPRRVYKVDHIENEQKEVQNGIVNQFKMWGFWVCGFDAVHINNGEVMIIHRRGIGCCSERVLKFRTEDVTGINLKKRSWCSVGIIWAFFISCLFGIWLHFIPCIWWTCDWGYFDGQGVRGAIWFVSWGLLFFPLVLFYPIVELEMRVEIPGSSRPKVYTLAAGEGCARSLDDPVATHNLRMLRELIRKKSDVEGELDTQVCTA